MEKARLKKVGDKLLIRTPYNAVLVEQIRGIPGRAWDATNKQWVVPIGSEKQVRDLIRQFFEIEGEDSDLYQIVKVTITGKASSSRRYIGGVTIDEQNIFDPMSGYLDMRPNGVFEILDYDGGFTKGDSLDAFEVAYQLTIKVRRNAVWAITGQGEYQGHYEFVQKPPIPDVFKEALNDLFPEEQP